MITTVTSNYQNQYLALFNEAYEALKAVGKLPEVEGQPVEAITSLEQYFFCLEFLREIDDKFVFLLPLDEPVFEIDANSRVINIPAAFKKNGIAVQGDVIAETLMFSIGRFFDGIDLNETDIWVQWEKADGSEGVSKINFKYIHKDPNVLMFAWPITSRVTDLPGSLKFAVRFEKRSGESIFYSLNTIPANVTINKALNPDTTYEDIDDASALFESAIKNSNEMSDAQDAAVSEPKFDAEDAVINPAVGEVNLAEDNTLSLKVQAIVADTGSINYTWTKPTNASVSKDEYIETVDITPKANTRYYVQAGEGAYVPYTEDTFPTDGTKVFERYSVLSIAAGTEPVVGTYTVQAINRLGWGTAKSDILSWTIPEAKEPTVQDLAESYVITESTNVLAATASTTDDGALGYQWEKNVVDPEQEAKWVAITDATERTYALVTELPEGEDLGSAGWYRVKVTNTKNRNTTEPKVTTACKTTYLPQAPILDFKADEMKNVYYEDGSKYVTLSVNMTPYISPLQSEEVECYWYDDANFVSAAIVGEAIVLYDDEGNDITTTAILMNGNEQYNQATGLDTGVIVLPKGDPYGGSKRCVVVNKLNGNTICSVSGQFVVA